MDSGLNSPTADGIWTNVEKQLTLGPVQSSPGASLSVAFFYKGDMTTIDNSNGVIVEILDENGLSVIKLVHNSGDFKFITPSITEDFLGAGNHLISGWNLISLSIAR